MAKVCEQRAGETTGDERMTDCGKIPKGDKGQRYEVHAETEAECEDFIVGWTERADGEPLVGVINAHPSWHSPRVIDRRPSGGR